MERGTRGSAGLSRGDRLLIAAVVVLVALVAVALLIPQRAASRAPPPRSVRAALGSLPDNPCGRSVSPPERYEHVIWIWFENQELPSVIGNGAAPFITGLAQRYCGYGTAWLDNVLDTDSLPNYIAATAGANCDSGTINDETPPGDRCITGNQTPAAECSDADCPGTIATSSIFEQLQDAGRTWKIYAESMPANCSTANPSGDYYVKHNPAPYFSHLRSPDQFNGDTCSLFNVPFPHTECDGNACRVAAGPNILADDLTNGTLPAFGFVTPDLCNGMHDDCAPYGSGVRNGDDWLAAWMPRIVNSSSYRAGTTAVFLMWDEGDFGRPIPNVVLAPSVRPRTVAGTQINNIAVLRATEQMLSLPNLNCATGTQGDGSPCPAGSTADLRSLFGL
jgi:phosphoesterase family protein